MTTSMEILLSLLTPVNYLLFLTASLLLFLIYLVIPRGVRAEYCRCCGAGRRRYRRRQRLRHVHDAQEKAAVVPQDVLESIYAHSHSYNHDYTGSSTIASPAAPGSDSAMGDTLGTTSTLQSSLYKAGDVEDGGRKNYSNPSPYSYVKLVDGTIGKHSDVLAAPRSAKHVNSGGVSATPRLGMPRPPDNWQKESNSDNDSGKHNNMNGIYYSPNNYPITPEEQGPQFSQPTQQIMTQVRKLLGNPPGIRLIAHGTKCNPRSVWITLHYSSDSLQNDSTTPPEYQNCMTWRAELRSPSSPSASSSVSLAHSNISSTNSQMSPNSKPRLGNLRTVPLTDILGIELGKRTVALRRVQTARLVKDEECFSLLTRSGTLDLQCVSLESTGSRGEGGRMILPPARAREAFLTCLYNALASKGVKLNGLVGMQSGSSGTSGKIVGMNSPAFGNVTGVSSFSHASPSSLMSSPVASPSRDNAPKTMKVTSPAGSSATPKYSIQSTKTSKSIGDKLEALREQSTASHSESESGTVSSLKLASEAGTALTGKTGGSATISTVSF